MQTKNNLCVMRMLGLMEVPRCVNFGINELTSQIFCERVNIGRTERKQQ